MCAIRSKRVPALIAGILLNRLVFYREAINVPNVTTQVQIAV
jgi:hypothetical protein